MFCDFGWPFVVSDFRWNFQPAKSEPKIKKKDMGAPMVGHILILGRPGGMRGGAGGELKGGFTELGMHLGRELGRRFGKDIWEVPNYEELEIVIWHAELWFPTNYDSPRMGRRIQSASAHSAEPGLVLMVCGGVGCEGRGKYRRNIDDEMGQF